MNLTECSLGMFQNERQKFGDANLTAILCGFICTLHRAMQRQRNKLNIVKLTFNYVLANLKNIK